MNRIGEHTLDVNKSALKTILIATAYVATELVTFTFFI